MRSLMYVVAGLCLLPEVATAAAPNHSEPVPQTLHTHRDVVVEVGPDEATIVSPATAYAEGYRTLFINRCAGGITIKQAGFNDSRTNSSTIVPRDTFFSEYPHGDASFNEVMVHVRKILAPFDIIVTDVDPGDIPHTEIIACGDSFRGDNVLGVAPFGCGIVQNAIGYAFAENHQNDPRAIAETIAHEAGHTFSLNHLFDCEDPMTYLNGCGPKGFVDAELSCAGVGGAEGWETQSCSCGGATQNSYQTLKDTFGLAAPTPPELKITAPSWGQNVEQEFPIRAIVEDFNGVAEVALTIDGQAIGSVNAQPYVFNAPENLSDGVHIVGIMATDTLGASTAREVSVCIGNDCPNVEPEPGQFGSSCASDLDCQNDLCAKDGDEGICTERCGESEAACPGGFSCVSAVGVCWPETQDSSGCSTGGNGLPLSGGLLLLVFALFRRRQRA